MIHGLALAAAGFALLAAAPPPGATSSFVAVDTANGRVLRSQDGERLGTPASVTKLLVAIVALDHLGPGHQAVTRFEARGTVAGGTLDGDLVVRAVGDPTWSDRFFAPGTAGPFDQLATALTRQGLRRITGDLVVDRSRLPGRAVPLERSWADLAAARGAPTSALAVDENAVAVRIAPGATVGAPASAVGPPGLPLRNAMMTVGPERHGSGTVDAVPDPSCGGITLAGEYPISEPPWDLKVASPNPDQRAGEAIVAALAARGIRVAGSVRLVDQPGPTGVVLAEVRSPPLAAWLEPILHDSENWLADMLLRHLGAVAGGSGRLDDAAAFTTERLVASFGAATGSIVLVDGSGLAPTGLATAGAISRVLTTAAQRPWFAQLLVALPANGRGTLRTWNGLPATTRAKTGSLSRHVGLAGYLTTRDGRLVAFAGLVGPIALDRSAARAWITAQVVGLDSPTIRTARP